MLNFLFVGLLSHFINVNIYILQLLSLNFPVRFEHFLRIRSPDLRGKGQPVPRSRVKAWQNKFMILL